LTLTGNTTITIEVRTRHLRPGGYALTPALVAGDLRAASRRCPFEVAEPEPLTHFAIYLDQAIAE